MRIAITGACGFIGSHTAELAHLDGHEVLGIDAFTGNYDVVQKVANLQRLRTQGIPVVRADLTSAPLAGHFDGCDVVIHLAALPGVRTSWQDGFAGYTTNNVLATQRVLEAALQTEARRVVYASSSSVYGNQAHYPALESALPAPFSPYGVTKLAAEHLCRLYSQNFGLESVSLRYFTVFGPRQRPDMAFHRLFEAAKGSGKPFRLFGDGMQIRDFTYVGDVARANLAAATRPSLEGAPVINIAGGGALSMLEAIETIRDITGATVPVRHESPSAGDVRQTGADISTASDLLGWEPQTPVTQGLHAQWEWHRTVMPPALEVAAGAEGS